jgi:hypothetical protein
MNETTSRMPYEASPQANADARILVGGRPRRWGILTPPRPAAQHFPWVDTYRPEVICENARRPLDRGAAEHWKWPIEE